MAAAGMILAADLISTDQINWKPAGQIKGLLQAEPIVEGGGGGGLFPNSKPTPPPAPTPATQLPTHLQPGQNLVPAVLVDTGNDGDTIHFRCRNCDKPIRAGKKWVGKKFKCTRCGRTSKIPSPPRDTYVMICAETGQPAKRPARIIIWAVVSMILSVAAITVFEWLIGTEQAGGWSAYLGWFAFLLMAISGGEWITRDAQNHRFGYFIGMAYAVLSIALFFLRAILIPSEFPPDHELRELMPMMIAYIALFYLLYPIITIAILNSRPVRKYLSGTPMLRK
jgi:hypothetical protein